MRLYASRPLKEEVGGKVVPSPSDPFKPHTPAWSPKGETLFRGKGWGYDVSTGAWRHYARISFRTGLSGQNSHGKGGG
jgi:hypothetical protein